MTFIDIAISLLVKHEGFEPFPYKDSRGVLSIGFGRNLLSVGISRTEALQMMQNDVQKAVALLSTFWWWENLTDNRKAALVDVTFDLEHKILTFHDMIGCLEKGDFAGAANALLDSEFANQVGQRAKDDADLLRLG